jgi:adenylate cyclase
MGKEIERKFLLAKGAIPIPEDYQKMDIKQAYLNIGKEQQIRVRIIKRGKTLTSQMCVKFTGKLIRDEFEYDIPLADAKVMYDKCKFSIEKKRLSFISHTKDKVHYDVDSFPNGMQWVEVEFSSIKQMKSWEKNKPYWIGKEITGVSKFSNTTLAKKKIKF